MDATPTSVALSTVVIATTRMEELSKFYADGLGLPAYERLPGHLGVRLGSVWFGFDQVAATVGGPPSAVSPWFDVADLEATYRRFLALGAKSKSPPTLKPWGARLAAVFDPDGNTVGLSQRAP